jgi:HEAT repeat protein
MTTSITGYEPSLSVSSQHKGYWKLSPRRLGTLLNVLPPHAISLGAAAAMLHSDSFFVRYNAARLLSERGDREARLVIQNVLTTGNTPSRASVARHLHRFSWFSVEPLLRQALVDPDEPVREGAVYALCDLRELAAYKLLVEVLQYETDFVRAAAAWELRNCQDSAAVPVLEAVLLAHDPEVRINALEALSANNTSEAVHAVRGALNDPDREVVYNATLSLIELREENSLIELCQLIEQTAGERLEPILRGLFHATNYLHLNLAEHPAADTLMEALTHAASDDTPAVRMAATWILAWIRHPRAAAQLKEMYDQESESGVKAHILRVTAALMSEVGPELLEQGLSSSDPEVRGVAKTIAAEQAASPFARYDEDALPPAAPLNRDELSGRLSMTRR